MPGVTKFGLMRRGTARNVLAAALLLQATVIALIIGYERGARRSDQAQMTFNFNPGVWWRDNVAKPTLHPPIVKAPEAKIQPDELVFGVEIGGRARAYRLAAFDDPSGHLVNDLIGGVPVSVAYCNLSRCVRVYTDPQGSAPLDAEVSGLLNQQMVIKLCGTLYFQNSGIPVELTKNPPPIPYNVLTPTLTTWTEWAQHHPDTDVFVGGR